MGEALAALHERGIVHRDLKPANVHLFEEPPLDSLDGMAPAAVRERVARMLSKKASARPAMGEVVTVLRA